MVPNNFHLAQTTKTIVVIETELILLTTDLQDCKNSMIIVPIGTIFCVGLRHHTSVLYIGIINS